MPISGILHYALVVSQSKDSNTKAEEHACNDIPAAPTEPRRALINGKGQPLSGTLGKLVLQHAFVVRKSCTIIGIEL